MQCRRTGKSQSSPFELSTPPIRKETPGRSCLCLLCFVVVAGLHRNQLDLFRKHGKRGRKRILHWQEQPILWSWSGRRVLSTSARPGLLGGGWHRERNGQCVSTDTGPGCSVVSWLGWLCVCPEAEFPVEHTGVRYLQDWAAPKQKFWEPQFFLKHVMWELGT